jgi:hypothetical protein
MCSCEITQNKREKRKSVCTGGSKKWGMQNLPASASRDLADLIDLLEFCVTKVLVHVPNVIHGKFGAMDPMRLNYIRES